MSCNTVGPSRGPDLPAGNLTCFVTEPLIYYFHNDVPTTAGSDLITSTVQEAAQLEPSWPTG